MEQLFNLNHEVLNDLIEKKVEELVKDRLDTFLNEVLSGYVCNDFLLSREEVATKLNLSIGTIDNFRKAKKIKGYLVGKSVKFKNSEILDYIKNLK